MLSAACQLSVVGFNHQLRVFAMLLFPSPMYLEVCLVYQARLNQHVPLVEEYLFCLQFPNTYQRLYEWLTVYSGVHQLSWVVSGTFDSLSKGAPSEARKIPDTFVHGNNTGGKSIFLSK